MAAAALASAAARAVSSLSAARSRRHLARFARSAQFRHLHEEVVGWLGGCFARIEDSVPGLASEAAEVTDWCGWRRHETGWFPQLWPPADRSVSCSRQVTAYYRFSGHLPDLLGRLARALGAMGWEVPDTFAAAGQLPPVTALWRTADAPAGTVPAWLLCAAKRHAAPSLSVVWTRHGHSLGLIDQGQPARGNPYWYSVEFTPVDRADTPEPVPESGPVTVGIQVHVTYYTNSSIQQSPLPQR